MAPTPLSRPYKKSSSFFLNFQDTPLVLHALLLLMLAAHADVALASESHQQCTMSDKAQATVTVHTTALITIVSTFFNPFDESFIMAWIAWLPLVRGAAGVVIYAADVLDHVKKYFSMIISKKPESEEDIGWEMNRNAVRRGWVSSYYLTQRDAPVGIWLHVIWWVWHVYMPYTHRTWFAKHYLTANSGVFFARGTAVGVLLVAMSIDYKTRVIRSIGSKRHAGPFLTLVMSILSLLIRVSLLGLMSTELMFAAIHNPNTKMKNSSFIPVYIIFSIVWGAISFVALRGRDHDVNNGNLLSPSMRLMLTPFAGTFFACFTCMIAFIIFQSADANNGLGIAASVKCDSVSVWEKIQCVVF
ncbi:hypothetical protein Hypma_016495 [Hypsizygus marmoreus]|uniref:Uncharacterized protein n=1 Tax=Hypsizygus marmoreus TaxID=39966 RepID=A0A369J4N8_HYPMA|nr:hypothetical protein Hypma_016495 [Hypsizygus marmoreus]